MRNFICGFILVLTLGLLVSSCTPDANEDRIDHSMDENYYQLGDIGTYWEYQLDSLIFDNQGATQLERTGYMRIEVAGVETKDNSDVVYTMKLYGRTNPTGSWREDKLYRVEKNIAGEIFVVIDNLVFREFSFPFSDGSSWENVLFDAAGLELIEIVEGETLERYRHWDQTEVLNRDTTLTVLGETYDSIATLQEVNFESFTDQRRSNAYYANGIGLVLRERSVVHSQCINMDPDCASDPWEEKAEKGYFVTQKLLEYSIEQ